MIRGVLVHVLAAASLSAAFTELARDFERTHPGSHVQLAFAGTPQLVMQIRQGAPADVFASADERWMDELRKEGAVEGPAAVFARNRLVVITPKGGRAPVDRLQDLARPGLRVVIGAETVPVGRYAREMLHRLAARTEYPAGFERAVRANVVSEEENVNAVVGRVQIGEADAGICYRSDVSPAVAARVRVIEVPDSANVVASYPIAVVAGGEAGEQASAFVRYVLSEAGQRVLQRHGFTAAPRAP